MTLGEKLSKLRKENNITQEQLAETLGVSRQSISKWESDIAYPETDKLIRLSNLFDCSLDYLLKNQIDGLEPAPLADPSDKCRKVSLEEAKRFLDIKQNTSKYIAIAAFLCILSPICLFILGVLSEIDSSGVTENMAAGLGMIILLIFVAIAVAIFIVTGKHTAEYEYLEKEPICTDIETRELVLSKMEGYKEKHSTGNLVGTILCILSLVPLFFGVMVFANDDFMMVMMLCLMFIFVGIGVMCFIVVGIKWASYEKLLQQGDYSLYKKAKRHKLGALSTVYWLCATAIYLFWSFITNDWHISWIVWPVAGVLYPAMIALSDFFQIKKDGRS